MSARKILQWTIFSEKRRAHRRGRGGCETLSSFRMQKARKISGPFRSVRDRNAAASGRRLRLPLVREPEGGGRARAHRWGQTPNLRGGTGRRMAPPLSPLPGEEVGRRVLVRHIARREGAATSGRRLRLPRVRVPRGRTRGRRSLIGSPTVVEKRRHQGGGQCRRT